ncbi:MAG: Mu-like prophage major head subunit gpT family protein [Firmicutes bacterium]|nr:Mu-like prophage major head subunit gpT family protein [Bacillota bacterium]
MGMTREQFAEFLNPIIHEVYDLTLREKKDFVTELYDVNTTKLWEETIHGVGALGLMQPWAGTVHYDDAVPLYKKTFVQKKYSLGLQIERELWEFSQHAKIKDRIKGLATSVFRTRQLHAISVFNNAFTANGADGVPLCSANHPFSPSDPTVQSNTDTLALTGDNLEAVAIKMQEFTDDRGNKLLIQPDTLIVPRALKAKALEITKSDKKPHVGAENAINVHYGEDWDVVVIPWLTDANNWFVVDSQLMKQIGLKWFESRKPIPERNEDFDTEFLKWKVVCLYDYGFVRWEWIFGNQVA